MRRRNALVNIVLLAGIAGAGDPTSPAKTAITPGE
jgi:hypothetical protein